MKRFFKALFISLIFPAVYLVMQLALSLVYSFIVSISSIFGNFSYDEFAQQISQNTLLMTLISALLTILTVFLLIFGKREKPSQALGIHKVSIPTFIICMVCGVALNIFTSIALSIIPIPESALESYVDLSSALMIQSNPLWTILIVGIFIPIAEEIVFRGICFSSLKNGMRIWAAILFQAIIFAAVHIIPLQIAFVFPAAIIFGLIVYWSDSLLCGIATHIGYNTLSSVLSTISGSDIELNSPVLLILLMLVSLSFVVFTLIYCRKKHISKNEKMSTQVSDMI